jgi:hypothetical protein
MMIRHLGSIAPTSSKPHQSNKSTNSTTADISRLDGPRIIWVVTVANVHQLRYDIYYTFRLLKCLEEIVTSFSEITTTLNKMNIHRHLSHLELNPHNNNTNSNNNNCHTHHFKIPTTTSSTLSISLSHSRHNTSSSLNTSSSNSNTNLNLRSRSKSEDRFESTSLQV